MNNITGVILLGLMLVAKIPAHADWIEESLSPHCSEESRAIIAQGTRHQIESSVRRAEAAIQPPSAIGDLSCLDGLMDISIDWFAQTGSLGKLFQESMNSTISSDNNSRRVCKFAEQQWQQLSRPLSAPLEILKRGLPPDLSNGLDLTVHLDSNKSQILANDVDSQKERLPPQRIDTNTPNGSQNKSSNNPKTTIEGIWKMLYGSGVEQ